MHMWMWFGYDVGDFLFAGLTVSTRWSFAITWIVLFFVALLFEGSKVYLAKVQREALKKLLPYRSDERRTLLCDREQGGAMEPTTSRNTSTGQVSRWTSLKMRALVNAHQSMVFVAHNTVGYLLMLAVMLYNVQLLLAVVLGMMLGYFLFGTKLTRLQMQCFSTKRVVICTPECDDTDRCNTDKCSWEQCEGRLCKQLDALELQQAATVLGDDNFSVLVLELMTQIPEITQYVWRVSQKYFLSESATPPLLQSPQGSESELFICRTRTCIQPSHYFPAAPREGAAEHATCYYGAQRCPARVARAVAGRCHHQKDDGHVEDSQLLGTEHQGCCKKPVPQPECCEPSAAGQSSQSDDAPPPPASRDRSEDGSMSREDSPQITCCHNARATPTASQEQIIKDL